MEGLTPRPSNIFGANPGTTSASQENRINANGTTQRRDCGANSLANSEGRFQAGGIIQAPARRAGPRPLRSTTRRREPGRPDPARRAGLRPSPVHILWPQEGLSPRREGKEGARGPHLFVREIQKGGFVLHSTPVYAWYRGASDKCVVFFHRNAQRNTTE